MKISKISEDINDSGIHPVGHMVLVRPVLTQRMTGGGIVIPEVAADKNDKAQIKAVLIDYGPTAWLAQGLGGKPWAKRGDTVVIGKYSGVPIEGRNDVRYRIVRDDELQARLDE